MHVTSLRRKEESRIIEISEGFFQKDKGLVGDINGKGGDKQVSIFTKEARETIEKEGIKGLCTERFYENITIEGINVEEVYIGQELKIGATIQEITYIGKKCFPECKLVESHKECPLSRQVVFTKIKKSGSIRVGDIVDL